MLTMHERIPARFKYLWGHKYDHTGVCVTLHMFGEQHATEGNEEIE